MADGHLNGMDAPVSTIRIKVGAGEYEPRWSFLTEFLLSSRGLTLQEVLQEVSGRGKKAALYVMELLAASIAHHFPAGAAPTAEVLAREVGPAQFLGIWQGLLAAGRAGGVIVNLPKNEQPASSSEIPPQQ
jgi:hypothetical protein